MAAEVYIDRIDTLSMREENGTITGITRKAFVRGLTGTDFNVMYDVLEAAGIPASGSAPSGGEYGSWPLRLRRRNVTMTDPDSAEVVLEYGLLNDQGQDLKQGLYTDTMLGGVAVGKLTCSVQQQTTNLYRDPDDDSGSKETIILEHTYPADDPDYPSQTVQQSGEITVYVPQKNLSVEGVLVQNTTPTSLADDIVGAVNSIYWMSGEPYTWLCTEMTWEYRGRNIDEETNMYHIALQFQHNKDTWNPTAVFIDDRTGRPPENLVSGEGYQYIRYHKAVNFTARLGFSFLGGVYQV